MSPWIPVRIPDKCPHGQRFRHRRQKRGHLAGPASGKNVGHRVLVVIVVAVTDRERGVSALMVVARATLYPMPTGIGWTDNPTRTAAAPR